MNDASALKGNDPAATPRRSGIVLAAMCLGQMLTMFTSTLTNVLLPDIASTFGSSHSDLQWVATIYTLCFAALLLPGGGIGVRFGRRRAFLAGCAIFALASLGCAVAPSLPVLLAARVAQSVGAAVMAPQSLAVLMHEYEGAAARARVVGIWAGVASLGLVAGPVLGGVIVGVASWRWGFVLSLLLGIVALLLTWVTVPASRHGGNPGAPPIDLAGVLLSIVALGSIVYGFIESANFGWTSPVIIGAFALGLIALAAFFVVELRLVSVGKHPLMPLRMWRSGPLIAANLAGLGYFFTFFSILYFYSIELQEGRGYSPELTGLAFIPMTLMIAVVGPIAGRLSARFGPARVMFVGQILAALGCIALATLPADASFVDLEWRLLLNGLGAGLMSSPMNYLAVSSAEPSLSSTASAVHNVCRQIGATLGVAVLGVLVTRAAVFAEGLNNAMFITAAVLFIVAVAGKALTRSSGRVVDG